MSVVPEVSFHQQVEALLSLYRRSDQAESVIEEVLRVAARESGSFFGAVLTSCADGRVVVRGLYGEGWTEARKGLLRMAYESTRGVIEEEEATEWNLADARSDERHVEIFPKAASELHLPFAIDDGQEGMLRLGSVEPGAFTEERLEKLRVLAGIAGMTVARSIERGRHLQARRSILRAEKDAWSTKVLRGIAHEINSPLTAILGQCSILGSELGSVETRAMIGQMQKQIERTGRFVSRLNAYGVGFDEVRASGKGEETGLILLDVVRAMSDRLAPEGIRIENALSHDLPSVMMRGGKLERILVNLIENSARAIHAAHGPGEGVITIESGHPRTGVVRVAVHDNGEGMDGKAMQCAFEPFFKGASGAITHGGLGLWLARETIRDEDGHIWAESEPGQGTSIFIELPVASPEGMSIENVEKEAEQERVQMLNESRREGPFQVIDSAPERGQNLEGGIRKLAMRVLIVDDEHYIREILCSFFKACSCTVDKAEDGLSGLGMALQNDYDIIVSDIRMPKMSGMEFYRSMINEKSEFKGQFVFISGELMTPDYRAEVMETERPFLIKPFLPEDILNLVPFAEAS